MSRWQTLALIASAAAALASSAGCAAIGISVTVDRPFEVPAIATSAPSVWRVDPSDVSMGATPDAMIVTTGFSAARRHAAERLQTSLGPPTADAARLQTRVQLTMPATPLLAVPAWKDITIDVESTLPDGRVVKSAPLHQLVDERTVWNEALPVPLLCTLLVCTPLPLGFLFFPNLVLPGLCLTGGYAASAAVTGVAGFVNLLLAAEGQAKAFSTLMADALDAHARDLERARRSIVTPTKPTTRRMTVAIDGDDVCFDRAAVERDLEAFVPPTEVDASLQITLSREDNVHRAVIAVSRAGQSTVVRDIAINDGECAQGARAIARMVRSILEVR